MRRINLVTDGIAPHVIGGMQRHSKNLLVVLLDLGIRVHLIHPKLENDTEVDIRESLHSNSQFLDVTLIKWPDRSHLPGGYVLENWIFSKKCRAAINAKAGFSEAPIIAKGFTSLQLFGSNQVWINLHGYEMFQRQFSLKGWLASLWLRIPVRYLHSRCHGYFSYGPGITQICLRAGLDRDNHFEIPGGVSSSWVAEHRNRSKSKGQNGLKFVFVGRNERRKALPEIMEAWACKSESPNRLILVGPHSPDEWGNPSNIDFLGEIQDVNELMSVLDECDILVCPSHSEGMPNVIMEGMARGLAIIATDVGAVSTLVDDENGILLDKVSVGGLLEAFNIFNAMSQLDLESKQEKSLLKMQSFTWDSLKNEYQRFFDQIFS